MDVAGRACNISEWVMEVYFQIYRLQGRRRTGHGTLDNENKNFFCYIDTIFEYFSSEISYTVAAVHPGAGDFSAGNLQIAGGRAADSL